MSDAFARPGFHFTLESGHLNDPLGVTWHDGPDGGRYDLFFQLNPDAPTWAPACRWGQADGRDLVRWGRPRVALEPGPGEGCWSGAVTVDRDGTPVILYTSVDTAAPDLGRVALARGGRDWSGWTAEPGRAAVVVAPPELDLHSFRDPFVRATPNGWAMLVGGGTRDGRALALQFSSGDLRQWRLDGPVAERAAADADPLPTGTAWECPQLVPLDGGDVLLVSAWDGAPLRVVAAVGDCDGRRFAARAWQPFDAGGELYATTAFTDAAGRWCALSWLPGVGPPGSPWAGAFSLPYLLSVAGDRLLVAPHPDVDRLLGPVAAEFAGPLRPGAPLVGGPLDPLVDVELAATLAAGSRLELTLREEAGAELLRVVRESDRVVLGRPGRPDAVLPVGDALRTLLDVGIVEAFSAGSVAALRLGGSGGPLRYELAAAGGAVQVDRFAVRTLQRWFSR